VPALPGGRIGALVQRHKWPKAAAKITDDLDVLLAFYDYPAEHWIHLRTTNPIESTQPLTRVTIVI
jgi:transposase-like protein